MTKFLTATLLLDRWFCLLFSQSHAVWWLSIVSHSLLEPKFFSLWKWCQFGCTFWTAIHISQLGTVTAVLIRKRFYAKLKVFDLPIFMLLVFKKDEGDPNYFYGSTKKRLAKGFVNVGATACRAKLSYESIYY